MAEIIVPVVEEIIGHIVVKGIEYIVVKGVDGIISFFADEDGDGLPDNPDVPDFDIDVPTETEFQTDIIVINSDGTLAVVTKDGSASVEMVEEAYTLYTTNNSIMEKKVDNYNTTEGLLLLSVLISGIGLIRGLFTRKDVFR